MHGLTLAEYQTVRAILDHPDGSERDRIEASGVPSSTYTAARRRVYSEGWLTDLMVPNPGPSGVGGVDLELVRPSISDRRPVTDAWSKDPECVLLWEGVHSLFGIFFRPPGATPGTEGTAERPSSDGFSVRVRGSSGSVPVYFDYSGSWGRFGGEGPPTSYPVGLDLTSPRAPDRILDASREYLRGNGEPTPGNSRWLALERSTARHRQAIEQKVVQPRTILEPARVPSFEGRRLGEVVLIQGQLRGTRGAAGLLEALTGECGVYPFLLAEADRKVILGGIGQTMSDLPGRVPAPAARSPVTPVIAEFLEPAKVLLEPAESIVALIQHRYWRSTS